MAEVFADIKRTKRIDFVPHFWRTLATNPDHLELVWSRLKALMHPEAAGRPSRLDPLTREIIALAVSATNGCAYCINSHTAAVRKLGLNVEALGEVMAIIGLFNSTNALADGYQIEPDILPPRDWAPEPNPEAAPDRTIQGTSFSGVEGCDVRVYLRTTPSGLEVAYREDRAGGAQAAPSGMRGWVHRKLEHFKTSWHNSQGGLARRLRQVWDWLHRRMPPDETMLARLHSAPEIEVRYPDSMTDQEVRTAWRGYLSSRQRRHWPWFLFNAVSSPLTLLLIPVPGPNVVGFWFAYRTIHHGLILHGLGKARSERIATSYQPTDDLSPWRTARRLPQVRKPADEVDRPARKGSGSEKSGGAALQMGRADW